MGEDALRGQPGLALGGLSEEPQGQGKGNVYQTEVKNQPIRRLPAPGEAAGRAEPGRVTPGQGKGNAKPEVAAEQSRMEAPRGRGLALPCPPLTAPLPQSPAPFLEPTGVPLSSSPLTFLEAEPES